MKRRTMRRRGTFWGPPCLGLLLIAGAMLALPGQRAAGAGGTGFPPKLTGFVSVHVERSGNFMGVDPGNFLNGHEATDILFDSETLTLIAVRRDPKPPHHFWARYAVRSQLGVFPLLTGNYEYDTHYVTAGSTDCRVTDTETFIEGGAYGGKDWLILDTDGMNDAVVSGEADVGFFAGFSKDITFTDSCASKPTHQTGDDAWYILPGDPKGKGTATRTVGTGHGHPRHYTVDIKTNQTQPLGQGTQTVKVDALLHWPP